jgi:hypothetical protein
MDIDLETDTIGEEALGTDTGIEVLGEIDAVDGTAVEPQATHRDQHVRGVERDKADRDAAGMLLLQLGGLQLRRAPACDWPPVMSGTPSDVAAPQALSAADSASATAFVLKPAGMAPLVTTSVTRPSGSRWAIGMRKSRLRSNSAMTRSLPSSAAKAIP